MPSGVGRFVSQREELKTPVRELVHDPIHGSITLEPHEKLFLDTPIFQRLRRVKQLQTAHFVYPGANHTRFEHTLGVFHIASYFADSVLEQLVCSGVLKHSEKLHYKRLVKLWALFHDVGHGPFSHTFDNAVMSKIGLNHEKLSIRIIKENDDICNVFASREFKETGLAVKDVVKAQEDSLAKFNPVEKALLQIIKGPYSADTTDYLLRDSYHTGVEYGKIAWQRLILTSRIVGDKMCLEKRSKAALVSFFFARHQMFDTVYYHRTNSAADRMIRDILERASDAILPYVEDLNKYVDLDEESLMQMLKNSSDKTLSQMTRDYMNRRIPWRLAYEEQKPINESLLIELLRSEHYQKAIHKKISEIVQRGLNFYVTGFYIPETPLNPFRNIAEVDIYNHDTDSVESWNFIHDLYMHSPFHTWLRVYIDKKHDQKEKQILVRAAKEVFSGNVADVHM